MNQTTIVNDEHYQQAIVSVNHTLDRLRGCTDDERQHLRQDLAQLQEMVQKLTAGRVEIVAELPRVTHRLCVARRLSAQQAIRSQRTRSGCTAELHQPRLRRL